MHSSCYLHSVENVFVFDMLVWVNALNRPIEMYSHHLHEYIDTFQHQYHTVIDIDLETNKKKQLIG